MTKPMSEARDNGKLLFVATMDIQKVFDVVPHSNLLRKLFHKGLKGKWWVLKQSAYTEMHTKIIWNGKTGDIISLQQGTRQGGIASMQDFKTVMMNSTSVIHNASQGTHRKHHMCQQCIATF